MPLDIDADDEVSQAMWEGDTDRLWELVPCGCCCDEHFRESCPARQWQACRGQDSLTWADLEVWAAHYGMTVEEFYSIRPNAEYLAWKEDIEKKAEKELADKIDY